MNTFTADPTAARAVARQIIDERVRDAEERRIARAVRAERRSAARAFRQTPDPRPLPWWTFRFLRPAH
jgi:hypothetical protein